MTQQAESGPQLKQRGKMINWRNGEVRLAKGARSPRPSPNHEKKEEQDAKRSLLRVMGGRTDQVTHQEPCRRKGSRPRNGGNGKPARKKSRRDGWSPDSEDPVQCEIDADEIGAVEPRSSPVVNLEEYRQRKTSSEVALSEQKEEKPPEEKPHIWTDADFTPEVLAAYDAQQKASMDDAETARQRRQELEAVFDSAGRKKNAVFRAVRSSRTVSAPEEDKVSCVHHMDLNDHPQAPPQVRRIEKRPMIGSSHSGAAFRSRKSKPQP